MKGGSNHASTSIIGFSRNPNRPLIRAAKTALLADAVIARSGTNFKVCYQCQACAGGCPFVKAMDYPPNAVFRLLQYGMSQEALTCKTIWVCVGCHTCSSQCPMGIDHGGGDGYAAPHGS